MISGIPWTLVATWLSGAAPIVCPAESPDVYAVVVNVAIAALPDELRPYFEQQRNAVRRSAAAAIHDGAGPADAETAARHCIWLDVASERDDWPSRREAATRFPRDRTTAERHFTRHETETGGSLPWEIVSKYRALVNSLPAANADAVADAAGGLLHFAADAALPSHTTRHRGRIVPDAEWASLRERLAHEAAVWPQRCRPVPDVNERIFETLLEAHRAAETLAFLHERAQRDPAHTTGSSSDHDRPEADVAAILEDRLEAGALLGATLIVSAWIESGRPGLSAVDRGPPAIREVDVAMTAKGGWVGSRNSTVVHRIDCAHAVRIKPENRVYFNNAKAAHAAGRTPCKACDAYGTID